MSNDYTQVDIHLKRFANSAQITNTTPNPMYLRGFSLLVDQTKIICPTPKNRIRYIAKLRQSLYMDHYLK